jgi:hypothetical protein
VGDEREPHFAHRRDEEHPECEEYFPGTWRGSPGTLDRSCLEVEDSPDQAGLCLEDTGDGWTLYLRLPEIPNEELGNMPLSSLQTAWIDICVGDDIADRLDALDLRPGVGFARACVPPNLQCVSCCAARPVA